MKWIVEFFRRRAERLACEELREVTEKADRLDRIRRGLERRVAKGKAEMLAHPCPFNNGEPCCDKCVHFKEGEYFATGEFTSYKLPSCKLWGGER